MTTSEAREVAATSTVSPERARPAVADRFVTSPRQDLVTVVLGAVMVGGLLSDAWAHTNIIDTIESFFTPWHAALYSGFAATAAWTFWLAYRRRSVTPRWWRDGWPVGYLVGAIGAVGFMVGGFLDMVWHTIFGIEASLDIAFSPSHILLSLSGTLLLTSPLRAWWATGERGLRSVTGVLSLALGTVFASILLTTFSAFTSIAPTRSYDHINGSPSELAAALGLAGGTSTRTRVERYTSPITDWAMASSSPISGPKTSTPTAATIAARKSSRRTRRYRSTAARSISPHTACTTTALSTASGIADSRGAATRIATIVTTAVARPATWVRHWARTAVAVLDRLPATAKPPKSPAMMLAAPVATNSWSASTS